MAAWRRVYGVAQYSARWVQRSHLVEFEATGLLPCTNYYASIEPRSPESSSNWNMIFYVQDICISSVLPFQIKRTFALDDDSSSIISVFDAVGEHQVVIEEDLQLSDATLISSSEKWCVYSKLPKKETGPDGCFVAPESSILLGIYYSAFGPAEKDACDKWLADNCDGISRPSAYLIWPLADDVLPWPWAAKET